MTFSGMTLDQFNIHKVAITAEVANNLAKEASDVTLTPHSTGVRRQLNGNIISKSVEIDERL